MLAILQLEAKGGLKPHVVGALNDYLSAKIFETGRFDLVNRDKIDAVMKEFRLQKSTVCDSTKCYADLGGAMGADKLLYGSVSRLGNSYITTLRLIDITLIAEEFVGSEKYTGAVDDLTDALDRLVAEIGEWQASPDDPAGSTPPRPVSRRLNAYFSKDDETTLADECIGIESRQFCAKATLKTFSQIGSSAICGISVVLSGEKESASFPILQLYGSGTSKIAYWQGMRFEILARLDSYRGGRNLLGDRYECYLAIAVVIDVVVTPFEVR